MMGCKKECKISLFIRSEFAFEGQYFLYLIQLFRFDLGSKETDIKDGAVTNPAFHIPVTLY
ncbi:hypothetical protein FACS189430_08970 [Bacteroidia bacterium]|nr:hypothetical protein FACS189430_08970 [Bacteroidia bacterium]